MKKILATALMTSFLASSAFAGGMALPMAEETVKPAATSSSSGWLIPLLLLAVIAGATGRSAATSALH